MLTRGMVCAVCAFWAVCACPLHLKSAELERVVAAPSDPLEAGGAAAFWVYFHNSGPSPVEIRLPRRLACRLTAEANSWEVDAVKDRVFPPSTESVSSGAFVKARYGFPVPESVQGDVTLTVLDLDAAPVLLRTAPPAAFAPPDSTVLSQERLKGYKALDTLFTLYQPYLANLGSYQPIYFLAGADPADSKFQVSFKYRFFNPESTAAKRYPWLQGIHFAYTQTSFWDLKSASKPFEDTSYKPELFFLSANLDARPAWLQGFFLQSGFQHESNGRGGRFSRSTNFLYFHPIFIFFNENRKIGMMLAPRMWTYLMNEDENNPDLNDYRGYFDVDMKIGQADGLVLGSRLGWAEKGGSVMLDLTYPLHNLFRNSLSLYFQVQYVSVLAESLIDYRQRNKALRFGFSIVR